MTKIWTQKQRERGDKRVAQFTAVVEQRGARLEKAQATLAEAQERVKRHETKLELEASDLTGAEESRALMERKCHCCGTGFRKTDSIVEVFGPDGETKVGDRCASCQAIALVLNPGAAPAAPAEEPETPVEPEPETPEEAPAE